MRVRTAREIGLRIRDKRRGLGWSQAHLAAAIGTSRQWVIDLEGGKPTVEVGLVLKTLSALNLAFNIQDTTIASKGIATKPRSGGASTDVAATRAKMDSVLTRARGYPLKATASTRTLLIPKSAKQEKPAGRASSDARGSKGKARAKRLADRDEG